MNLFSNKVSFPHFCSNLSHKNPVFLLAGLTVTIGGLLELCHKHRHHVLTIQIHVSKHLRHASHASHHLLHSTIHFSHHLLHRGLNHLLHPSTEAGHLSDDLVYQTHKILHICRRWWRRGGSLRLGIDGSQ